MIWRKIKKKTKYVRLKIWIGVKQTVGTDSLHYDLSQILKQFSLISTSKSLRFEYIKHGHN